MEISEIISDALVYPFHNLKALAIYLVLGIILGIELIGTVSAIAVGGVYENVFAVIGAGIIGIIITILLACVIDGYILDVIKFGINRDSGAPGLDFLRQFINGFKFLIVSIVYYIIPVIIAAILAVVFQHWLSAIINVIIAVIFSLALTMAQCRLAKSEDLMDALSVGEAIGDISRAGILNVLALIIITFVVSFILVFLALLISKYSSIVGGILFGAIFIYLAFFSARSLGLLYSNV